MIILRRAFLKRPAYAAYMDRRHASLFQPFYAPVGIIIEVGDATLACEKGEMLYIQVSLIMSGTPWQSRGFTL